MRPGSFRKVLAQPSRLTFTDHTQLLDWLEHEHDLTLDLDTIENIHIWSLVALATLTGRPLRRSRRVSVSRRGTSAPARFAHIVGYDAVTGVSRVGPTRKFDERRTV